jgi:indolepyruvate ferredoxin oxidoreductase alpha subunit
VFSAIKLMQRELGPTHISADIGCHSFATFAPFSLGNSILGYGMSLASAAAVTPNMERRPIAVMGDGGRTVHTYGVAKMTKTLKEAMRTAERGLKVIIADGECQLARQRRVRAEDAEKLKRGERVIKTRFGVDDEICTGDHSCIRLSGCPSLTVKPSPDPLRTDPVATVIESCVGCGLCGEVAHAAVLCPSFYRADIIRNARWRDRALYGIRRTVIGWLSPRPSKAAA